MGKEKTNRRVVAFTGAVAAAAGAIAALYLLIDAFKDRGNKKKRGLPGSSIRTNLSASEIVKLADQIIVKSKDTFDTVSSIPLEKVSYSTVIKPLADLEAHQFPLVQSCLLPKMVAVLEDVRQASAFAEKKLDSHFLLCRKREDVYRVSKSLIERGEWLDPEAKRYIHCLVKDFERHGANLTLSKRREMESLKSEIERLSLRYIHNLNGDNAFLLFNESELDGMSTEFIKSLERNESGSLKVSLRSHHVSPILEHCKIGATRKAVAVAYGQRCGKENLDIVKDLVQLRHKFARLLGYPNYADYIIEPRMARTSAKVFEFLEEVSSNITDVATRELNMLKDLKRKEEGDSPFGMEDLSYYMRRAEEEQIELDLGEVKEFFPVNLVLSGIFRILQDLFGLRLEEIKDVEVWHETVRVFSVLDFHSNDLLGYFYLDMYAREGKYAHTCVLPLQDACLSSHGNPQVPIALILSQCSKSVDGHPVLLRFSEVVSLLHEFSHVVHHICNRAKFSRLSGLRVEADFVEIPGQLLENWCYESISLKMMSGFYKDITKSITSEMCKLLERRRDLFSGLKLKQEILLCLMDQIIHSSENVDTVEILKHLHPKIMVGIPLLEGTNPASCFPRIAIGYEASCYSYIWSEAFAADIFTSKFRDNLLNQHAGLQFRNKVLAPGGAQEPLEILSHYLGREPSIRSFIENKSRNSLQFLLSCNN